MENVCDFPFYNQGRFSDQRENNSADDPYGNKHITKNNPGLFGNKDYPRCRYLVSISVFLVQKYLLHGPSMFAVKAKIYGVIYKQSSSIAFDETSIYWSAPKTS